MKLHTLQKYENKIAMAKWDLFAGFWKILGEAHFQRYFDHASNVGSIVEYSDSLLKLGTWTNGKRDRSVVIPEVGTLELKACGGLRGPKWEVTRLMLLHSSHGAGGFLVTMPPTFLEKQGRYWVVPVTGEKLADSMSTAIKFSLNVAAVNKLNSGILTYSE